MSWICYSLNCYFLSCCQSFLWNDRTKCYCTAGWETFLSYEDPEQDILVGLLRLRKCSNEVFRPELKGGCSIVRELHVYGSVVPVNARDPTKFQHQVSFSFDQIYCYILVEVLRQTRLTRFTIGDLWPPSRRETNSTLRPHCWHKKLKYDKKVRKYLICWQQVIANYLIKVFKMDQSWLFRVLYEKPK